MNTSSAQSQNHTPKINLRSDNSDSLSAGVQGQIEKLEFQFSEALGRKNPKEACSILDQHKEALLSPEWLANLTGRMLAVQYAKALLDSGRLEEGGSFALTLAGKTKSWLNTDTVFYQSALCLAADACEAQGEFNNGAALLQHGIDAVERLPRGRIRSDALFCFHFRLGRIAESLSDYHDAASHFGLAEVHGVLGGKSVAAAAAKAAHASVSSRLISDEPELKQLLDSAVKEAELRGIRNNPHALEARAELATLLLYQGNTYDALNHLILLNSLPDYPKQKNMFAAQAVAHEVSRMSETCPTTEAVDLMKRAKRIEGSQEEDIEEATIEEFLANLVVEWLDRGLKTQQGRLVRFLESLDMWPAD